MVITEPRASSHDVTISGGRDRDTGTVTAVKPDPWHDYRKDSQDVAELEVIRHFDRFKNRVKTKA